MSSEPSAQPRGNFDAFFANAVVPLLGDMEAWRKRSLWKILAWWIAILPVGVGACYALAQSSLPDWSVLVGAVATLVALMFAHSWYFTPYREEFKARLVGPLIRAYDANLRYDATGKIGLDEFRTARLFRGNSASQSEGEDLISGQIGATALRFSELHVENVTVSENSKGGRSSHNTTIFKGLFFIADFNKHFVGSTYVLPDRAQRLFGALGQSLQSINDTYGTLVKLEDPEFERLFAVYASDQIEARYILSSALMQRIVAFQKRSGNTLRLAFFDTRLYIAISLKKNLFEPRLYRTINDLAVFREFWDDLELVVGIVEDLNLNTRIWTKA